MKLVTAEQMRVLEQGAVEAGVGLDELMVAAGLAVAQEVWLQLGQLQDRRIAVLVGPGNNGADGLVAARHLAEWGAQVRCYALRPRRDAQWRQTVEAGIPCSSAAEDEGFAALQELLGSAELIVDALLGTGTARPIEGDLARILRELAQVREGRAAPKLVAVDLPTGLDSDSGRLDPLAVPPDETVTFAYPKVGLYTQPGAAAAGDVQTVDIGIPATLGDRLTLELIERRQAKALLPPRPVEANKGTFGKVLVVAGSAAYPGAAILAASAAYRSGAGLVTLATAASLIPALVAAMPEVTYLPLPEGAAQGSLDAAALPDLAAALPRYDALLVGCGLGTRPGTASLVRQLLRQEGPAGLRGVVVDADGLNALAATGPDDDWPRAAPGNLVLTPHPGEMARLRARDVSAVQAARLATALDAARAWGAVVVLKGANTVIAGPDGAGRLSAVAHPALATAGTGDVLAGATAGLLAQGLPPFNAATLAVYLHANAGKRAARARGTAGTTASDVLAELALAGRSLAGEEPLESAGFPARFGAGGAAGLPGAGAGLPGMPTASGGP